MITLLGQALAFLYVLVLPGWWLVGLLDAGWGLATRLLVGFTLAALILPMASFVAAWVLATNVHPTLVLGVATVGNVAGATHWLLRRRRGA